MLHGKVHDVSLKLWCRWCDAGIGSGGRGPGRVSGAGGLPSASVLAVGAVLLLLLALVSGCSLVLYLVALRVVGCHVCCFVCFRRPRARWVFLVVARSFWPCSCAPVLVMLVRARGLALHLGVCLLRFPAVVCAVTPVPPVTKRRSSWACMGHPNPEQETIKGTHAQEIPVPPIAYCSRVGFVAIAVPAPSILCFAPLSIVTAVAL